MVMLASFLCAVTLVSADYPSVSESIDACAAQGGGRVVVPSGTHEMKGPVRLRSNVELHFEDGARLVFPDDEKAYLPAVPTSWEGTECLNYSPLVYAYGVTNAAITGKGTLSAKLKGWYKWKGYRPESVPARMQLRQWGCDGVPLSKRNATQIPLADFRPHLLQLNRCKDIRLEGFTIRGTPFWTVHVYRSSEVLVKGLDVNAWNEDGDVMNNSDGVDIDMSNGVTVEDCTFFQNDDAIVIKAGKNEEGRRDGVPCENILIRRCTVNRGHVLLGIGSEVSAGIRNVRLENCRVNADVNKLVFIKTSPSRGGFIENIVVDGIEAKRVNVDAVALLSRWYYGQPPSPLEGANPKITRIDGLTVRNVHCEWVKRFVTLCGDPNLPVKGVRLENVTADEVFERLFKIEHIEDVKMDVTAKRIWPDSQW